MLGCTSGQSCPHWARRALRLVPQPMVPLGNAGGLKMMNGVGKCLANEERKVSSKVRHPHLMSAEVQAPWSSVASCAEKKRQQAAAVLHILMMGGAQVVRREAISLAPRQMDLAIPRRRPAAAASTAEAARATVLQLQLGRRGCHPWRRLRGPRRHPGRAALSAAGNRARCARQQRPRHPRAVPRAHRTRTLGMRTLKTQAVQLRLQRWRHCL
mmetsp:Transcript_21279/g.40710  ORF Transcript_21279/g.40710 Transcript_21279/m.40710 type:complete len:213 (+) Transcript_21279:25-663(+)